MRQSQVEWKGFNLSRYRGCIVTSKEERQQFLSEMADVRPIRVADRADVLVPKDLTPGQIERQRSAVNEKHIDQNPLTADHVELLRSHDVLSFQRPGMQHGVFRKLRLGHYSIEARLDLHRVTVEEARKSVFDFIATCQRYELRTVMILHGKGDRNPERIALIKSHVAKWLPELDGVMAFHSALPQHGGTGAVYVLLRKGDAAKQLNRERHGV